MIEDGEEFKCTECGVEPLRIAPSPILPSAAEVEEHRITHIPYRSWCRECVEGKALGEHRGHGRPHHHTKVIPVVGMDYFYATSKGVLFREELEFTLDSDGEKKLLQARKDGTTVKCLMVRCSQTKASFVHVVPVKGVDEDRHVVKLICSDIEWLGHVKLILKCDNEPAIRKILEETLIGLKLEVKHLESVSREHPERYESQSNGMVEVGIKNFRAQYRTMRACLQRRLGGEVPVNHPVSAWLMEHCCLLMNVLVKGDDGLTAWARARGRPFGPRLVGFVETCLYKLPLKGPQHNAEGNMAARWKLGTFLGYSRENSSYIVATEDGITTSRALMRRPMEERWDRERVQKLVYTPWSLKAKTQDAVIFKPVAEKLDEFEDKKPGMPRRFKILKRDLDNKDIGYTQGCPQCDYINRYGEARGGLQHSERCRTRVMAEVAKTSSGLARVQRCEERITRAMAETIERSEAARPPTTTTTATSTSLRSSSSGVGVTGGIGLPSDEPAGETPSRLTVGRDVRDVPGAPDPMEMIPESDVEGDGMDVGITEEKHHPGRHHRGPRSAKLRKSKLRFRTKLGPLKHRHPRGPRPRHLPHRRLRTSRVAWVSRLRRLIRRNVQTGVNRESLWPSVQAKEMSSHDRVMPASPCCRPCCASSMRRYRRRVAAATH